MTRRRGSGRRLINVWRGDDLLALGEHGLLVEIDDFELVRAVQVLLADRADVFDGVRGAWRHAGDVEAEDVFGTGGCIAHLGACRLWALMIPSCVDGRMSRPTSTRSLFNKSPMIFLIGSGRRRTSVGTARIWSPRASTGSQAGR